MRRKVRTLIRKATLTGLSLMTLMAAVACLAEPAAPPEIKRTTQPLSIDFTDHTRDLPETTEIIPLPGLSETVAATAVTNAEASVPTRAPARAPTLKPTPLPTPTPTPFSKPAPTCASSPHPTAVPTLKPTLTPACSPVPTASPGPAPAGGCQIFLPGIDYTGWEMDAAEMAKARELIRLVNEARQSNPANPGNPMPMLVEGAPAMWQCASIRAVEIKTQFQHNRPTDDPDSLKWYQLLKVLGITSFKSSGENITGIDTSAQSPQNAFNVLWNSQLHRENFMNPYYDQIAIGVFTKDGTDWYVQIFLEEWK